MSRVPDPRSEAERVTAAEMGDARDAHARTDEASDIATTLPDSAPPVSTGMQCIMGRGRLERRRQVRGYKWGVRGFDLLCAELRVCCAYTHARGTRGESQVCRSRAISRDAPRQSGHQLLPLVTFCPLSSSPVPPPPPPPSSSPLLPLPARSVASALTPPITLLANLATECC